MGMKRGNSRFQWKTQPAFHLLRPTRQKFSNGLKKLTKDKDLTEGGVFATVTGFRISRKNEFLGRWIKHGGFWPDPKLRLFHKGMARFEERLVHEDAKLIDGISGRLQHSLLNHSYPPLADYIDHMNGYSSLGAEMAVARGPRSLSLFNIVLR